MPIVVRLIRTAYGMLICTMTMGPQHRQKVVIGCLVLCGLMLACSFVPYSVAAAQKDSNVIAQSFSAKTDPSSFVAGALVAGKSSKTDSITLATIALDNQLLGVVATSPLVSLSSDGNEIPVVLSGTTMTLISDFNGPVKSGDKITTSPVAGVGMLATTNGQIIGTVQADFNVSTSVVQKIIDSKGKTHTIHIQKLPLSIGVSYYNIPSSDFLPPFIHNFANSIAGNPVSLIKIIFGGIILFIGLTYTVVIIYSSTRSAITALGRNPLGAKAIAVGQYRAIVISIVIAVCALLATYLLFLL